MGIYIYQTSHGEFVFTSFDIDDPEKISKQYGVNDRQDTYLSRCRIPANLLE